MDRLFEAIRVDRPYSEVERSAYASLGGILGRMAAESGQEVAWDQALGSDLVLAPGLENYTYDSTPPITPDEQGRYPIAMPGVTKAF
jgi:myo-inositol 2-dehydrogenase / D-chiro-inositol 1-dehydrogenase